jgi:chorismate mutase
MKKNDKNEKKLFALRGATLCLNDPADIKKQVTAMYDELLKRNNLAETDIVSIIFSVTQDLDAKNPASALREEGKAGEAALFVTQEAHFSNSLSSVIRLLIHCYLSSASNVVHVYRNGAEVLRPDRKVSA